MTTKLKTPTTANDEVQGMAAVRLCVLTTAANEMRLLQDICRDPVVLKPARAAYLSEKMLIEERRGKYWLTAMGLSVIRVYEASPDVAIKLTPPVVAAARHIARDYHEERVFLRFVLLDMEMHKVTKSRAAKAQLKADFCVWPKSSADDDYEITGFGRIVARFLKSFKL